MSIDEEVARHIVETLRDGQKGYKAAAEQLGEEAPPQVVKNLTAVSEQRGQFADDIVQMGKAYGDDVADHGSIGAAFERGWMSIKTSLTGPKMTDILQVCQDGDEKAVEVYTENMAKEISPEFHKLLEIQLKSIQDNLDILRSHT